MFGDIELAIVEKAIIHLDEQTRLDSLALICENPKTTEAIGELEFELLKKFLYYNSDTLSPSYRQSVLASLKKFFNRLRESWLFGVRSAMKSKHYTASYSDQLVVPSLHQLYTTFVDWLVEFTFSSLHLDSTFAKRNQHLMILTLFIEIVGQECQGEGGLALFSFRGVLSRQRLLTLIEMLWDTYLMNKNLALDLLLKVDKSIFEQHGFSMSDYFSTAINLLSSRKPIDSMTSVYLILFIKRKAHLDDLVLKASQTHMACFYAHKSEAKSLSLFLVKSLVKEFENQCKLMQQNLLLASLQKPVYGSLAAIRNLILQSIDEIKKNSSSGDEWKQIIDGLIALCFIVSKVTSSIVNSSSPEGIFPVELLQMQPELANSDLVKHVTPQMLLVCCWRTMKEISLFFGDIVTHLPIEHESTSHFVLAESQVFAIGDYFVRHLFETRHRGTFELAYVGFSSMCETFWKCTTARYCSQPNIWLEHMLALVQSEESKLKLCSTRRGGGLPFFVQAIVCTELADKARKSLDKCMRVLLKLAEANFESDEKNFSKVLAMYILGALFKDARLGEDVLQYAESALIIAIDGFDSVFWHVRNASTLLFSSLVNRIFGVNRSKVEISKKNSLPGRLFFSRFAKLYDLFMRIIIDAYETINVNLNAKLYLVVLIFCHLFTLSDESSDPEALLHTFVPGLLRCSQSPVMKTRIHIAKAITAIVSLDRYHNLVSEILDTHLDCGNKNNVNGILHILNHLLDKQNIFKLTKLDYVLEKAKNIADSTQK
mgnify:CR=1 FL=1